MELKKMNQIMNHGFDSVEMKKWHRLVIIRAGVLFSTEVQQNQYTPR